MSERSSGILMPVFSLPSKYGIGSFGKECYEFVDFLSSAGQKIWQILPLVETGYGNSPYSSVCSDSFNPFFISPEILWERGLIDKEDLDFTVNEEKYVDYGFLYSVRLPLLKKAFDRAGKEDPEFTAFLSTDKAEDYALFSAIKYKYGGKPFYEWEDKYLKRDKTALETFKKENPEEYLFRRFLYFEAEREWLSVKKYANDNGVKIIGDIPLYVAGDSADVWAHPELFKLGKDYKPRKKAGVPPDYFSKDGQLWGNPVYDYEKHKKDGFSWWIKRLNTALSTCDYVRIDHFRGLSSYYEIDGDSDTAKDGEWVKVPSDELFSAIENGVDKSRIVAEDLGIIDDGVKELLKKTGFPGMKVLSFAFNGEPDNPYLPEKIPYNSVCYTGTHDNDTLSGLIEKFSDWDGNNFYKGVKNSLAIFGMSESDPITDVIKLGMASKAKIFVTNIQDVLGLDSDYRFNEPGTVKPQNWAVRFKNTDFTESAAKFLRTLSKEFKR